MKVYDGTEQIEALENLKSEADSKVRIKMTVSSGVRPKVREIKSILIEDAALMIAEMAIGLGRENKGGVDIVVEDDTYKITPAFGGRHSAEFMIFGDVQAVLDLIDEKVQECKNEKRAAREAAEKDKKEAEEKEAREAEEKERLAKLAAEELLVQQEADFERIVAENKANPRYSQPTEKNKKTADSISQTLEALIFHPQADREEREFILDAVMRIAATTKGTKRAPLGNIDIAYGEFRAYKNRAKKEANRKDHIAPKKVHENVSTTAKKGDSYPANKKKSKKSKKPKTTVEGATWTSGNAQPLFSDIGKIN